MEKLRHLPQVYTAIMLKPIAQTLLGVITVACAIQGTRVVEGILQVR